MQNTIELTAGERLHIARRRAGLNTSDMAKRLRISANTIRSWEADRTSPKYLELLAWADLCAVEPEILDPDIRNRCFDHTAGEDVA